MVKNEALDRVLISIRERAVRATLRISPSESQRVFGLTVALGGICGLVAVGFHQAIAASQHLVNEQTRERAQWLSLSMLACAPAVGGAIVGLLLRRIGGDIAGSGVPQVKVSYALDGRGLRLRDAAAKFMVCVIQIGSGGSLGREGPTVQICAAVASTLGRWLALSPANLRRLVPVGAAAGVAAAFNAPIAAVMFTIEEIVGTLDQTVLTGVVAAAALAAVVEHSVLGVHPILHAPGHAGLHQPSSLLFYALLGVLAALASTAFRDALLRVRALSKRSTIPKWLHPALGGLTTGVLAATAVYFTGEYGISGGGYESLAKAILGQFDLRVLGILLVLKMGATVASYSSGGAGGIFAPTLFIGAMLGGLVGRLDAHAFGHDPTLETTSFALVGMGALFAGTIRAPLTSVLIIFELTGNYGLVLPLMIANSVSYVVARRMRALPIYDALLAQDGIHLPHGADAHAISKNLLVRHAMATTLVTFDGDATLGQAAVVAQKHGHATYPVIGRRGFVGLLSEARLARAIAEGREEARVESIARRKEYAAPDEPLMRAVARMMRLGVRQLPVLDAATHDLVGMIAMSDVLRAQLASANPSASVSASVDRRTLELADEDVAAR